MHRDKEKAWKESQEYREVIATLDPRQVTWQRLRQLWVLFVVADEELSNSGQEAQVLDVQGDALPQGFCSDSSNSDAAFVKRAWVRMQHRPSPSRSVASRLVVLLSAFGA